MILISDVLTTKKEERKSIKNLVKTGEIEIKNNLVI